jgi:ABC-type nitrate/sulfonate/bicarbonate transport system substrate-binding protein
VPEVRTIADLRGKELSVDTISTGTSFVLREMLERSGLEWNRDYTTVPAGAVQERYQLLVARKHAATMLMTPLEVIGRQQGLNILADVPGTIGPYQGSAASVRRKWARENEAALVGFIRGYRQSLDWLYNPANREAVLAVFRRNVESDAATAEMAYRLLIDPVNGFEPRARLNEEGMRTLLRLREKYARPPKKLQPLSAYYDPRYYEAASR